METMFYNSKLYYYGLLIRFDKPIGTLLLLWPTLWGLWVSASGVPEPYTLSAFILGTFLMRSAGCAFNDYFDRHVDGHVQRTEKRVLATGKITPKEALLVGAVLSLLALLLILPFNLLSWLLACIAAILAVTYPLFKRFFAIPQAYLGIAFGFGIPMAFAATLNEIPAVAWWMLIANICWTIAYDTEYALVDKVDDLKLGLKTSAITFGRWDLAWIAFFYVTSLIIWGLIALHLRLAWPFYFFWTIAWGITGYHLILIRHREPKACFKAFLHNNWWGFMLFLGLFFSYPLPFQ